MLIHDRFAIGGVIVLQVTNFAACDVREVVAACVLLAADLALFHRFHAALPRLFKIMSFERDATLEAP